MKNFCKFLCGAISLFVLSCSENIDTIGNSNVNGVVPKDEKVSMEIYGNLDDSFISGTRTGEGFIYPDYYVERLYLSGKVLYQLYGQRVYHTKL